jgi:transposase
LLTRDQHGCLQARLLDVVPDRSGTAYASWLADRPAEFVAGVQQAALDPFRGYANAIRDQLPDAVDRRASSSGPAARSPHAGTAG